MSNNIAIKIENLSKQYRLGEVGTGTLSHDLNRFWHRIRGKEDPYLKVGETNERDKKGESNIVWALRGIDFEVQKGDVLGIIGRNGAGKSTLLKILSKTTLPTIGSIKVDGRIASLLEVGTGFHPELTGRDNIFLNGAILGMTKREIKSKFEEIVDFAGVERYIDTPVKRYSSGMYVRLAFGVAAFLEQDILIVDEVLAVGDADFQKKAIGKMQDVSTGEGRTVLFVSHDMNAISVLTKKVIVLSQGKISFEGETQEGIQKYLEDGVKNEEYIAPISYEKPKIIKVNIETSLPNNTHEFGKELKIHTKVYLPFDLQNLNFSIQILDEFQNPLIHSWWDDTEFDIYRENGMYRFSCIYKKMRLYMGVYSLRIHLANSKSKIKYDYIESTCHFKVEMLSFSRKDYKWGVNDCKYIEDFQWKSEKENQ